jgi:K+-transporting ATPase A subunit
MNAVQAVLLAISGLLFIYLGSYMVAVYEGRVHDLGFIERPIYRLLGTSPEKEQTWKRYAGSLAKAEIPMVTRATGLSAATLTRLIAQQTQGARLGLLGSPYVNVLQLNEALAALKK